MSAKRDPPAQPAAHVIEPGSARYFAWLYAEDSTRHLLAALLEIERQVEASLRPGLEHDIAHGRLAWWHEECARLARGTPVHPATRRLLELAGAAAGEFELRGLVEATAWDLATAVPDTRAELARHCERWAGALIAPLDTDGARARALGAALRETELLLRLATDARRGRLRVPLDELDTLKVAPRSLASPPWPAPLADHLRGRLASLRATLAGTVGAGSTRALHAWTAVTSAGAARAIRALPRARSARRLDPVLDALHAWRAARAASRPGARMP